MAAAGPSLLDLPPDLLIRIGAQLPFAERLRLSLVCRRWRDVCAGPSELWSRVDAQIVATPDYDTPDVDDDEDAYAHLVAPPDEGAQLVAPPGHGTPDVNDDDSADDNRAEDRRAVLVALHSIAAFRTWLVPRAVAVAELSIQLLVHNPSAAAQLDVAVPARLLPARRDVPSMPALRHLTVRFRGGAKLSFALCPALPALRTLWLAGMQLELADQQQLNDFSCLPDDLPGLEFAMYHGRLARHTDQNLGAAWLPPCTTKLRLLDVGLRDVPGVVAHLPQLRSLELDANGLLDTSSLSRLTTLGALRQGLRQLDLGENTLPRFPSEVSALTNLRILFLYQNFGLPGTVPVAAQDWEALHPLSKLVFLSISSNQLRELPPAVLAMSHLRGLHIEDNPLSQRLAPHPCFANLLELLLDWKDALASPVALRACTRLTRLTLHNHTVWGTTATSAVGLPAAWGDRLLDALAVMPALRLVEDVVNPQRPDMLVPAVARCMWDLGRRCPHLRLEQLTSTYIGWSLGKMPAEVEAEVAASDAAAAAAEDDDAAAAAAAAGGAARSVVVRAASTTAPAQQRSLTMDISKRKLVDSYGGRAVRNIDNQIYEIVYEPSNDSVRVLNKAARLEYATEVAKDNRIVLLLDQTKELPGGLPSFAQLQSLLKASSPGAEALNGRLAMLAFVGVVATELATGRSLPEQLARASGAGHAAALGLVVMAASLAPVLAGRVRPEQAFPSENDSYATTQLPYFWTALAEIINGRVAMIGLAGLLITELVRGAPLL